MANFNEENELIVWISALIKSGGGKYQNNNLHLTPLAARRFGLSIHEKNPVICWNEIDDKALSLVKWKSAGLLFNVQGHDWIALSCPDIRVKNSNAMNPVKLRMYIPITTGRLDAWKNVKPTKINISVLKEIDGVPVLKETPSISLPVTIMA